MVRLKNPDKFVVKNELIVASRGLIQTIAAFSSLST